MSHSYLGKDYKHPQASDYASKLKSLQVDRKTINKQVSTLYNESMPLLKSKKESTKARVIAYKDKNPLATQREIATALELNQPTIVRVLNDD
ncbi:hypothetical protein PVA45_08635 (plasmid) [Entomospira entomophila]|uniref:Uncharacterized protein n=1 Tax=Entomospira entomophila TaxID=2719988 RepID=A0A968GEI1_9SPIO|nr:hypothetical protein [Entomospira entomophilus]NIZ41574.1 hypothetical protein [Entomospira entomophilus]WDI36475.1 hypothetical protein PVA45_08635 [Entomospira entomophilus]